MGDMVQDLRKMATDISANPYTSLDYLVVESAVDEIERLRAEVERLRNGLTAILHQANREDTESDYKIDMMRHLAQRILDGVTIHPMSPLLHAPGSQPSKEGVRMTCTSVRLRY